MDKALTELIRISKVVGCDRTLTQGGGGNTSVKSDDGAHIYIKASGTALENMSKKQGWRRLRTESVAAIINDKNLAKLDACGREREVANRLLLACDDDITPPVRPSVEAHLHAILDRVVIHLHPDAIGAYVSAKNGKAQITELFRNHKPVPLWVPYADPGFMLAKKITTSVDRYRDEYAAKPSIVFLEKHGLLVAAQTADTALQRVKNVISIAGSKLKQPAAVKIKPVTPFQIAAAKRCISEVFFEVTGRKTCVNYFMDDRIAAFAAQTDAKRMLAAPALSPQELIYSNGPAVWLDNCNRRKITYKLASQTLRGQKPSLGFLIKPLGLFIAGDRKAAVVIKDVVLSSFFIRSNAYRMGGINPLNKRQRDFIDRWEAVLRRLDTNTTE